MACWRWLEWGSKSSCAARHMITIITIDLKLKQVISTESRSFQIQELRFLGTTPFDFYLFLWSYLPLFFQTIQVALHSSTVKLPIACSESWGRGDSSFLPHNAKDRLRVSLLTLITNHKTNRLYTVWYHMIPSFTSYTFLSVCKYMYISKYVYIHGSNMLWLQPLW